MVQILQDFHFDFRCGGSHRRVLRRGTSQADIFKRVPLSNELSGVDFFLSNEFIGLKTK